MTPFADAVDLMHRTAVPVRRIADEAPLDANTVILEGYWALSEVLGPLLHGGDPVANATFPTFAMWTTETLRSEVDREKGRPLRPYGFARPSRELYRRAGKAVLGNDDVIGRNLAQGEAAIYDEIGSAIRKLVDTVLVALDAGGADWQRMWHDYNFELKEACAAVNVQRQDLDQPDLIDPTNVMALQQAVLPYFEVLAKGLTRFEVTAADRKRRAELILLATIRIEAYAQTRLRPVLERNLAYLPDALRAIVGTRLTGRNTFTSRVLRHVYERSRKATDIFDEAFEIAATRRVYSMVVGDEELHFGRDLPLPPPANPVLRDREPLPDQRRYALGSFFPRDLQTLESRAVWTAWQEFDRSTGEGSRTAVDNWLRYEERLNFIVNVMRSRQQLTALYDKPRSIPPAIRPRPAALGPVAPRVSPASRQRVQTFGAGGGP